MTTKTKAEPGAAAAAVEQTTLPLTSYLEELAGALGIWAARTPGAVAEPEQRAAATVAVKALDNLAAELIVIRKRLREQISANDGRMMVLAAEQGAAPGGRRD